MMQLGTPRHFHESLASTMDELNALAQAGAPEGTLVVAAEQSAGRGRAGRSWRAPRGSALLCSLLLRPPLPPRELGALPLVAGVAVAEAIEALAPVRVRLKWPNDVFIGDRKVCGVLMQARAIGDRTGYVNLGIGINVSAPETELPDGATSLHAASGLDISVSDVEQALMERLTEQYSRFQAAQGRPSLEGWLDRAMFLGEQVAIGQDRSVLLGRFSSVSPQGALILQTGEGLREIVSGDLTRGPRLPTQT